MFNTFISGKFKQFCELSSFQPPNMVKVPDLPIQRLGFELGFAGLPSFGNAIQMHLKF